MKTKICNKCKIKQFILNFNKDKSKEDGFYTLCKSCRLVYRQLNKEKIKIQLIKYRKRISYIKRYRICFICKSEFIVSIHNRKYCSVKCWQEAKRIKGNE